jgi:hypothetical protein
MDDDEFFDMLEKEKEAKGIKEGFCPFILWDSQKACLANVKLLGLTCKYCKKTFCQKHYFPEYHGCDEAVDMERYKRFATEAKSNIGNGGLSKPMDAHAEQLARNILRQKIQES